MYVCITKHKHRLEHEEILLFIRVSVFAVVGVGVTVFAGAGATVATDVNFA